MIEKEAACYHHSPSLPLIWEGKNGTRNTHSNRSNRINSTLSWLNFVLKSWTKTLFKFYTKILKSCKHHHHLPPYFGSVRTTSSGLLQIIYILICDITVTMERHPNTNMVFSEVMTANHPDDTSVKWIKKIINFAYVMVLLSSSEAVMWPALNTPEFKNLSDPICGEIPSAPSPPPLWQLTCLSRALAPPILATYSTLTFISFKMIFINANLGEISLNSSTNDIQLQAFASEIF